LREVNFYCPVASDCDSGKGRWITERQNIIWNRDGQITSFQDFRGNSTRLAYNQAGHLISTTSSHVHSKIVHSKTAGYNERGQPLYSAGVNGLKTGYSYDGDGRLSTKSFAGTRLEFEYLDQGNPDKQRTVKKYYVGDKLKTRIVDYFDALGRVYRSEDDQGRKRLYESLPLKQTETVFLNAGKISETVVELN